MSGSLISALIAGGLALLVSGCAANLDGEKRFNERCLVCHTISEVSQRLAGFTPRDREAHLESYLTAHHAPDRAERIAIILYINQKLDKHY